MAEDTNQNIEKNAVCDEKADKKKRLSDALKRNIRRRKKNQPKKNST